jgi:hypothetical protein
MASLLEGLYFLMMFLKMMGIKVLRFMVDPVPTFVTLESVVGI